VQYLKRSSFSIPLWEEWVIRASCCSVKLLSSLFRVRARDPLNIARGVPSKRIRVKRVRQKHLNNWRWCFMVQWRTEWSLLWIQVEKQIGTDLKKQHANHVKTASRQRIRHTWTSTSPFTCWTPNCSPFAKRVPGPVWVLSGAAEILLKTSVLS